VFKATDCNAYCNDSQRCSGREVTDRRRFVRLKTRNVGLKRHTSHPFSRRATSAQIHNEAPPGSIHNDSKEEVRGASMTIMYERT